MSLTLYHSIESTCSQKVRFVLSEKGLQWQQINLNLRKGDQFKPEYLKLNRKAVVPTLVHDGKVVRESSVIINYLEDVFPEPSLKPDTAYARALMHLLIKSFDEEVHPSVGILSYAIVLRHQMNDLLSAAEMEEHFRQIVDPMRRQRQQSTHYEGLGAAAAAQSVQILRKVISLMDEIKAGNTWLCGDHFSLADATAVPYLVRLRNIGFAALWRDTPGLEAWLNRAVERVSRYELENPWGSESFHKMVAGHVQGNREPIKKLLKDGL